MGIDAEAECVIEEESWIPVELIQSKNQGQDVLVVLGYITARRVTVGWNHNINAEKWRVKKSICFNPL